MTSLNSRKNIAEKRSTMHTSSHQNTAYRPGGRTSGEAGYHSTRHSPYSVGVLSTQGAVEIARAVKALVDKNNEGLQVN